jgi:hypothetical protein
MVSELKVLVVVGAAVSLQIIRVLVRADLAQNRWTAVEDRRY